MTWTALRAEITVELAQLTPTMWDSVMLRHVRRDEEARGKENRAQTKRRIQMLHAVGKVREARVLEAQVRAWDRRRKAAKVRP